MNLPAPITAWLRMRMMRLVARRDPDFVIGSAEDPYLRRWFVIPRNAFFNIYLHHFLRSDDDRALHDHPWWNVSLLIDGGYVEHTIPQGGINVRTPRVAGQMKFRFASAAHRVELNDGPCWTIFITGPRIRQWGFHCPHGWKHWQQFTKAGKPGEVGPGCGDDVPAFAHGKTQSEHAGTSG